MIENIVCGNLLSSGHATIKFFFNKYFTRKKWSSNIKIAKCLPNVNRKVGGKKEGKKRNDVENSRGR